MSRPPKIGLDYYPMDVGFLRDKKVRLLRSEFGPSSVLFVLYVLGKVYEGDGYFLAWDKDELLLAADELRETPTYISEVLKGCLTRSLFDERVFQMFGVLTSAGIQRRYLRGCEKRDVITVFSEYWLLNECSKTDVPTGIRAKLALVSVSGGNNPVNSPENSDSSHGNPESKVKKSRVKESKGKERGPKSGPPLPLDDWGFGPELTAAFEDWLRYKREKRQEYKPTGLKSLIAQVKANAAKFGEAAVVDLIRQCMAANWQGIIWERLDRPTQRKPQVQNVQPSQERIRRNNDWLDTFIAEQQGKKDD